MKTALAYRVPELPQFSFAELSAAGARAHFEHLFSAYVTAQHHAEMAARRHAAGDPDYSRSDVAELKQRARNARRDAEAARDLLLCGDWVEPEIPF